MSAVEHEKSMLEVQVQLLESALKSSIILMPPNAADNHDDKVFIQQPVVDIDHSDESIRRDKHFVATGKENSNLMQIAARELAII